jgi:hypothetical protein
MGKTHNNPSCAPAEQRNAAAATSSDQDRHFLRESQSIIGRWERRGRVANVDRSNPEEYFRLRSQALRQLTQDPQAQRQLVGIAQKSRQLANSLQSSDHPDDLRLHGQAEQISNRARELIILCHYGMIEVDVRRRAHLLKGESTEEARAVLRQEAWAGIDRGIDHYQFDAGANPLTYFRQGQIRNFLSKAIEREGGEAGIRLKARANELGKRVDEEARKIEEENRPVTVVELAERLEEPAEKIAEVLPLVQNRAIRMDAPVKSDGISKMSFSDLLVDDSVDVEQQVIDSDASRRVQMAIGEIDSPLQRRLLEMTYGLDGERVEQKDVFDGVYLDANGQAYSAEGTIISDRRARGIKVQKLRQSEINRRFKSGELKFEPGTKEAYELSRISNGDFDPGERYAQYITAETGIPPTSGTVYEAKRRAEQQLRSSTHLKDIVDPYRGDDQLEHSESARHLVRQELARRGIISSAEDKDLTATRARHGGKSKLRQLAEKHGLVDQQGRLDF